MDTKIEYQPLTIGDIFWLRKVRNQNRLYFTNSQKTIGLLGQIFWFYRNYQRGKMRIWVARVKGDRAGYGALAEKNGVIYVTECVEEKFRRQGIGQSILQFLIQQSSHDLYAEIWADNNASCLLHQSEGFVLDLKHSRGGKTILLYILRRSY